MTISQSATSLMCNFPSGNFPNVHLSLEALGRAPWLEEARGRALLLGQTGKLTIGNSRLGKYLWESVEHHSKKEKVRKILSFIFFKNFYELIFSVSGNYGHYVPSAANSCPTSSYLPQEPQVALYS